MNKKKEQPAQRRRYVRLDHIFPVAFRMRDPASPEPRIWHQAFSQDVAAEGLRLTVDHLGSPEALALQDTNTLLELRIILPTLKHPIAATARCAWCRVLEDPPHSRYAVGVAYEDIGDGDRRRIRRYVATHRFFKRLGLIFAVGLSAGLVAAGFYSARLRWEREAFVATLAEGLARQREAAEKSGALLVKTEELKFLLAQSEKRAQALEDRLGKTQGEERRVVRGLEGALDFFKREQQKLKSALSRLSSQQATFDGEADEGARRASLAEAKMLGKMHDWLMLHQNNRTGLVTSFEGDDGVRDWAFTYDQALAAIVFTKAGRMREAEKILDFYCKAASKIDSGGFANAYYASTGETVEFIAHAGPNIWLGLAALHHADKTGNTKYLALAKEIGRWLGGLRDAEGGLRGGAALTWYSTEHNLDAYGFYSMLHKTTGDKSYRARADETLAWLTKNAYAAMEFPVVKRGKGDATIATDTYAWSVSSVGPGKLREVGMDADGIMDFALAHCGVSVTYRRPEGILTEVKGFDFAKPQHISRGGVVSCEWTAQMILALKIMADHHAAAGTPSKAAYYRRLSDEYILELSKMLITSLSPVGQGEFCLPYASAEFADTGHGWRTPKGARTGSVAATAYAILAIEGFNPLSSGGLLNGPKGDVGKEAP